MLDAAKAHDGMCLELHVFLTLEMVGGGQIHTAASLP